MNYLFNDSADKTELTRDVWLTSKGEPVLATKLSADYGAIPTGGTRVGSIKAEDAAVYQLTKGNELTESGRKYCGAMGAAPSAEGLKTFIARNKNTTVRALDAVIPNTPALV